MIESWRWYGPGLDPLELDEIRQAGPAEIVTALHDLPYGTAWPRAAIAERRALIEAAGMRWTVVESLPVHDRIKRGEGDLPVLFEAYRQSMEHLAAEGIEVICYNFMPLLDWTRTDLRHPTDTGATCLRFEAHRMAAFELFLLERAGARDDYPQAVQDQAATWFRHSTPENRATLVASVMAGMPGAFDRYDIDGLRAQLRLYEGLGRQEIRANFARFLDEILPTAERLGLRMAVHPDDPPRDILGLPRVVSSEEDIAWILAQSDSPAHGITLCSGSLGAHPQNDVVGIARRFAHRVHFAHLRNVTKDADGSFEEACHLDGDTDMVALIRVLLNEEARRGRHIPFRPDHGHEIATDATRGTVPGYPLIGRLRGLAELRGVLRTLESLA